MPDPLRQNTILTTREEIAEVESLIESDKSIIKLIESNVRSGYYDREERRLIENIKKLQVALEAVRNERDHTEEQKDAARDRIVVHAKRLKVLRNRDKILRMKALLDEQAAMLADDPTLAAQVEALRAHLGSLGDEAVPEAPAG